MYHSAKPGVNRFQSTPGFKAGRYARCPAQEMSVHGFNPLPALRPGDTASGEMFPPAVNGFNPLPALRPGDTLPPGARRALTSRFQSTPGFKAGRYDNIVHLGS